MTGTLRRIKKERQENSKDNSRVWSDAAISRGKLMTHYTHRKARTGDGTAFPTACAGKAVQHMYWAIRDYVFLVQNH